jgi:hypothetical protein
MNGGADGSDAVRILMEIAISKTHPSLGVGVACHRTISRKWVHVFLLDSGGILRGSAEEDRLPAGAVQVYSSLRLVSPCM